MESSRGDTQPIEREAREEHREMKKAVSWADLTQGTLACNLDHRSQDADFQVLQAAERARSDEVRMKAEEPEAMLQQQIGTDLGRTKAMGLDKKEAKQLGSIAIGPEWGESNPAAICEALLLRNLEKNAFQLENLICSLRSAVLLQMEDNSRASTPGSLFIAPYQSTFRHAKPDARCCLFPCNGSHDRRHHMCTNVNI